MDIGGGESTSREREVLRNALETDAGTGKGRPMLRPKPEDREDERGERGNGNESVGLRLLLPLLPRGSMEKAIPLIALLVS